MSMTHHYQSNLRDILFNLFEVLEVGTKSLGQAPYDLMDEQTARDALETFNTLAVEELAPSFADSDRVGLTFDKATGDVGLPESLKKAMRAFYGGGWHLLPLPENMGGMAAPPSLSWSVFELTAGANPCVGFYTFGPVIAHVIERLGTPAQRKRYIKGFVDRSWGGSMVLTEPDAGSDVGAASAKARHVEGDVWEIEGVKRFITNGDYDGVENIVHLVLARPEGAPIGTKGLSMFIVPKFWVDDNGKMGERNGVYATNVEKKMGIKASATCELTFGDKHPARGLLVGERHDGIRQMFHVIEQARMAVGIKSMATLSTAYLNALAYAKERVQGPNLANALDKNAPRVRIIEHPDVRRMLMAQKAHAEGMRALCMYTAFIQDQVEVHGGHGAPEADALDKLNDLLLPLVKGYCSEKAYEMLALSLQTYGGSGYIQDYPAEQYIRDQKIDSLYEGTTHIQSLDFIFRKVQRDGGQTLQNLLGEVAALGSSEVGGALLADERKALLKALGDLQGLFMALLGKLGDSIFHVGLQANRVLLASAEMVIGWLLVKHAAIAASKRDGANDKEKAFYEGKIASAKWWCANVLPGLTLTRKLVESGTLQIMEVSEDAF